MLLIEIGVVGVCNNKKKNSIILFPVHIGIGTNENVFNMNRILEYI